MSDFARREYLGLTAGLAVTCSGCTSFSSDPTDGSRGGRGDEPTVEPTEETRLKPEETLEFGEWSEAPRTVAVAVDGFEIFRGEVPAAVGEEGSNELEDDEQLVVVDFRAKNISNEDRSATVDIWQRFGVFTSPGTYYGYGDTLEGPCVYRYGECHKLGSKDMEVRETELVGGDLESGSVKQMWFPAATDRVPRSEVSIRYDDRNRFKDEGEFFVEWE